MDIRRAGASASLHFRHQQRLDPSPVKTDSRMVYKYVTSSDGAQLYTEAYGDPTKPALVLVAGYSLHSIVFEKQLVRRTNYTL